MGKGLEGWSLRHLLMVSVALNVGLVLKLAYERESDWRVENRLHGFCLEQHSEALASASMAAAHFSTAAGPSLVNGGEDEDRVINLDQ